MKMIEEICKHCKHCLNCMCGDEFKSCELKKNTHDRAIGLFRKLPFIHKKYISDIEEALNVQKTIDIDKACADNVITYIGNAMLDPTISYKTKAELVRAILIKAIEE